MPSANLGTRAELVGNGIQTAFSYPFRLWSQGDLNVYLGITKMVYGVDYTTSAIGADYVGGSVTFNVAPGNGVAVLLVRRIQATREGDYTTGGPWSAGQADADPDKLTEIQQDVQTDLARTLRFADTTTGVDATIPAFVADSFLASNGSATALEFKAITASGAIVDSSTTLKGLTRYATNAEAQAQVVTTAAITASNLAAMTPTETRSGLLEIATDAECTTGTDDVRAITPLKLKTYVETNAGDSDLFRWSNFI